MYVGRTSLSTRSQCLHIDLYRTGSLAQLSIHLSRGHFALEHCFLGNGLFLGKDCTTVGLGISNTFTLVPLGPVSFNFALRSLSKGPQNNQYFRCYNQKKVLLH